MKSKFNIDVEKVIYTAKKLDIVTHPLRQQIILMLAEEGEKNVTQIYTRMNIVQNEMSTHLLLMKDYGILKKVRRGKMSIYSVDKDLISKIIKLTDELVKM
jgi:DNA-binding transcriptional ArsR family regulator